MRPVVLALFFSSAAFAGTRWGLTWRAPDSCIQPAELARTVEDRLGRPVFGPEPQVRVDGELKPAEAPLRWRARLTLVDDKGTVLGSREVTATDESCRSIDASLALVVAVMIDPTASLKAPAGTTGTTGATTTTTPGVTASGAAGAPTPPPPDAGVDPGLATASAPPQPALTPVPPPSSPADFRRSALPAPVDPDEPRPHQAAIGLAGAWGVSPQLALGLELSAQLGLTRFLRLDLRFPLYPYLPVATETASGWLSGLGAGAVLGVNLTPDRLNRWSAVLGLGVEWTGFITSVPGPATRADALGKLDLLARARLHRRLGDRDAWGVQLQLEGGYSPLASTMRLVAADGRPQDLPLGAVRVGLGVAFTSPFG